MLRVAVGLAGEHGDAQARERLAVETENAVARGNQYLAKAVDIAGLSLKDAGVVSAGGCIGALHQLDALDKTGLVRGREHGVKISLACFVESGLAHFRRTLGDASCDARGFADFFRTEIVAVGVAGTVARDHAHADAKADALHRALDDGFIDAEAAGGG